MKKLYYVSLSAFLAYWLIPIITTVENHVIIGFRFKSMFQFIGKVPFSQYLEIIALFLFLASCVLVFFKKRIR